MGYDLQAVIGANAVLTDPQYSSARVVPLAQGLCMIPLTGALFAEIQAATPRSEEPFPRFEKLSAAVAEWVRRLSERGLAAYIEAEFFGGVGEQSAVAWQDGSLVLEPLHDQDAINRALKLFGIEVGGEWDEFDAVGLGRHRSTDEWLTGSAI